MRDNRLNVRDNMVLAVVSVGIGLFGFAATGCGLDVNGGITDPTEEPDSSGGSQQELVVPREGPIEIAPAGGFTLEPAS